MHPHRHRHNPNRLQCPLCPRTFQNRSGLTQHLNSIHSRQISSQNPHAHAAQPGDGLDNDMFEEQHNDAFDEHHNKEGPRHNDKDDILHTEYHPHLTAQPCSQDGNYLPPGTPPPPRTAASSSDWTPFKNRVEFETSEFLYKREQMSKAHINMLMDLWAASLLRFGGHPPFANSSDMYAVIDAIQHGDAPWQSFSARYMGDMPAGEPPPWMTSEYQIWCRDPLTVIRNMLANPDFDGEFDYAPLREFVNDERRYCNVMSGNWAWQQADTIAEDPTTHGAMFMPFILGSDKTTVSVATGHNEYWPLYMSLGNVYNNVRRAHRNAIVVIGFLAIPKSERQYGDNTRFRRFRRQLFHSSLSAIFSSLRQLMSVPDITRCPDGHYRRVIYGIGPYIADYPEQTLAGCIVQGWCVTCTAHRNNLGDGKQYGQRTLEHREALLAALDSGTLWEDYGIIADVIPFTNDFPRADINRLMTPDLLHQIIKGAFYDHLVTWVGEYLVLEHGDSGAEKILDEIDRRRIAAVPAFAGLRRFPEGRNFKQWTGDDSKALMKVYIPAIAGLVPRDIVRTFAAFLQFCYLVRRSFLTERTLEEVSTALTKFHHYRKVFETTGVRPDGFSLPRQHSLDHYVQHSRNFGAPNGLCSSITESKHIKAVKEPWRRSNRFEALGQMLLTNQRLDKLAAAHEDFASRGMLQGTVLSAAFLEIEQAALAADEHLVAHAPRTRGQVDNGDGGPVEDHHTSTTPDVHTASGYPRTLPELGEHLGQPALHELVSRFLYDQSNRDNPDAPNAEDIPLADCPLFTGRISVFHSASATFYAPSDISGIAGMRRERIRATPSWRSGPARYDCVFVANNDADGFRGMHVAHVRLFFSFSFQNENMPCALVEWFLPVGDGPDDDTGMWIVEPDFDFNGRRSAGVIHLDAIVRAAHLIGVYGESHLPPKFKHTDSLDAFAAFYVNKYADHHAHEIAF
ncbi:hypothetical protein B0H21DRAFT_702115 [Amylocystis lapponica]|nr:hypothetical protein B0H21DRAFT_702115 [Amylocystis lapponica]